MTDRPILFSAPMVRALLDGRKTQTRRVLKPQPGGGYTAWQDEDTKEWFTSGYGEAGDWGPLAVRFRRGDRLWVRETWQCFPAGSGLPVDILYTADQTYGRVALTDASALQAADRLMCDADTRRPGIHMPRWASRLTLTVTDVRVQRLQECSAEDCAAEGACDSGVDLNNAQRAYRDIWEAINGLNSWLLNPWIVALTFTVERRNIDA